MKRSVIASVALATALSGAVVWGVTANADASPHQSSSQAQEHILRAKKLTISAFTFTPGTLKVAAGGKIKVVNQDAVAHTVTSDDGTSFDVMVPAKSTVTFKAPATKGTFTYHCSIHPTMLGALKVK